MSYDPCSVEGCYEIGLKLPDGNFLCLKHLDPEIKDTLLNNTKKTSKVTPNTTHEYRKEQARLRKIRESKQ